MRYYEVWIASQRYHGDSGLTYSSEEPLALGVPVLVPLQGQTVPAIVVGEAKEPKFKTKPVIRTVSLGQVSKAQLKLITWIKEYYPAPFGQIMTLIAPSFLLQQSRLKDTSVPSAFVAKLPGLTKGQQTALSEIRDSSIRNILLHGDTGTGKTRIYLELIASCIKEGASALLLTPEIGLTPQLVAAAKSIFPKNTVVLHSEQTAAQRRNAWQKIITSEVPLVIIGPRSALFAPIRSLGLIVVDEFHEGAYKQEQAPYYQATRVAAKLAELHGARLVLGSATPPIGDYYAFEQKGLPIIRLDEQAKKTTYSQDDVVIIDIKKRELFDISPWIASPLIAATKDALERGEQSLLFLNRRGTARVILCKACGWEAHCPRCDLPLTYHGDTHKAQCHTCGFIQRAMSSCPMCSNNDIVFRSIGTKSLVAELEHIFPHAKIARFDSDNKKHEGLEHMYTDLLDGTIDILVGTQLLGKGLDLPKLSVLGIIQADTSLSFPDYTAEERTYQLIRQALGRINRGHVAGKAFVQTHHPDNQLIKFAVANDYTGFYKHQLEERRLFRFPPFTYTLKLSCSRAQSSVAEKAAQQLAHHLQSQAGIEIIGPSPTFTPKINNRYHWQIIVKAPQRSYLTKVIQSLPANWSHDIDPNDLL